MQTDESTFNGDDDRIGNNNVVANDEIDEEEQHECNAQTSDESDSNDDDEGEPLLEYQRLPGAIPEIIAGSTSAEHQNSTDELIPPDRITCMRVHKHFLLAGTLRGVVMQMDLHGKNIRRLDCHTDRITDLSVDESGRYLASSSDDGTACVHDTNDIGAILALAASRVKASIDTQMAAPVARVPSPPQTSPPGDIQSDSDGVSKATIRPRSPSHSSAGSGGEKGLGAVESDKSPRSVPPVKTWRYNFGHSIKALEIDPGFGTRREKVLISGGLAGKLVITKRGWFRTDHTELHKGEGTISAIAWSGQSSNYIACANDAGVKVYDFANDQRVAFVERPAWMSSAIALCPCRLQWEDDSTLMVAWADSVKVVRIKERKEEKDSKVQDGKGSGEPKKNLTKLRRKYAEVLIWFRTDVFVCGIVPFGSDRIALLGYPICDDQDDDIDEADDNYSNGIPTSNGTQQDSVTGARLRRQNNGSTRELAQEWAADTMATSDLSSSSPFTKLLGNNNNNNNNNNSDNSSNDGNDKGVDAISVGETDVDVNVDVGGGLRVVRGQQAELRILTRTDGADVSSETLPLRGFERNQPFSYSLEANHLHVKDAAGLPLLLIVSPMDVVLGRPTDIRHRIAWAIEHKHFAMALELSVEHATTEYRKRTARAAAAAAEERKRQREKQRRRLSFSRNRTQQTTTDASLSPAPSILSPTIVNSTLTASPEGERVHGSSDTPSPSPSPSHTPSDVVGEDMDVDVDVSTSTSPPHFTVSTIVDMYLNRLFVLKDYATAAKVCDIYLPGGSGGDGSIGGNINMKQFWREIQEEKEQEQEQEEDERDVPATTSVQNQFDTHTRSPDIQESCAANSITHAASNWERWAARFVAVKQMAELAPFLPLNDPRLSSNVYGEAVDSLASIASPFLVPTILRYLGSRSSTSISPHRTDDMGLNDLTKFRVNSSNSISYIGLLLDQDALARIRDRRTPTYTSASSSTIRNDAGDGNVLTCVVDVDKCYHDVECALALLPNDSSSRTPEALVLTDALAVLSQASGRPLDAVVLWLHALEPLLPIHGSTKTVEENESTRRTTAQAGVGVAYTSKGRTGNVKEYDKDDAERIESVFQLMSRPGLASGCGQDQVVVLAGLDAERTVRILVGLFPAYLDYAKQIAFTNNSAGGEGDNGDREESGRANEAVVTAVHAGGAAGDDILERGMDPFLAVDLLAHDRNLVLQYLRALCEAHPQAFNLPDYAQLHDLQIELLAEKQPNRLGSFLMWSNFYSLNHALTVCESLRGRKLAPKLPSVAADRNGTITQSNPAAKKSSSSTPDHSASGVDGKIGGGGVRDVGATDVTTSMSMQRALVVILGRMGGDANMKKALKLILANASAVPEALSFIQQQQQQQQEDGNDNDSSLWASLVSEFVHDAQTITGVLQHVGKYHLDPRALVKALPPNLHLPNLKTHLISLFGNTSVRRNAMGDCVAVLRNDVLLLLRTLHRLQRRATKVERVTRCGLCARVLRSHAVHLMADRLLLSSHSYQQQQYMQGVVVFASGECYHTMCLTEAATLVLQKRQDRADAGGGGGVDKDNINNSSNSCGTRRDGQNIHMPTTLLTTLKHHCAIYADMMAQRERRKKEKRAAAAASAAVTSNSVHDGDDSTASNRTKALHEVVAAAMARDELKAKGGAHSSGSRGIGRGGGDNYATAVKASGARAGVVRQYDSNRPGPESNE